MIKTEKRSAVTSIEMTDKQIAGAVRYGRMVTFWPIDSDEITGYIGGWDRFNYFLLVPSQEATGPRVHKYLIHKGSSPVAQLHDESTFDKEPEDVLAELKAISAKFRTLVLDTYFPVTPVS